MPPEPDELTPEEARVRHLLAEARHSDPVPADVAARLDGVLADLRENGGTDRGDQPAREPTPVDLAAARRRRRARTLLVAAAAIVVVGVGIDRWGPTVSGGGEDAAGSGAADSGGRAAEARPEGSGADGVGSPHRGVRNQGLAAVGAVPLEPGRFAAEVARVRRHLLDGTAAELMDRTAKGTRPGRPSGGVADSAAAGCGTGALPRGRVVAVRYDGAPAHLVFHPVRGDTQVVDLYLCGVGHPTRSLTMPAP